MASESGTETQQTQSSGHRTFSIFIPFFFGFTNADTDPTRTESDQSAGSPDESPANSPSPEGQNQVQRVILVSPLTQGMVVIEGAGLNLSGMFWGSPEKEGPPPAAKSAIEAMPSVEIGEGVDGECAICLEEWVKGLIVKEMPCKHRFHGGCIEKWLGMHGSCPVCRYAMPTEEEEGRDKKGEERQTQEGEERGERREIWISFSFGGTRRTEEDRDTQSSSGESGDGNGSDSGGESGPNDSDGEQGEECGEEENGSNSGDESDSMEDID